MHHWLWVMQMTRLALQHHGALYLYFNGILRFLRILFKLILTSKLRHLLLYPRRSILKIIIAHLVEALIIPSHVLLASFTLLNVTALTRSIIVVWRLKDYLKHPILSTIFCLLLHHLVTLYLLQFTCILLLIDYLLTLPVEWLQRCLSLKTHFTILFGLGIILSYFYLHGIILYSCCDILIILSAFLWREHHHAATWLRWLQLRLLLHGLWPNLWLKWVIDYTSSW